MKNLSMGALIALGSLLPASMSFAAGPASNCLDIAASVGSVAGCEGNSPASLPVSEGGMTAAQKEVLAHGVSVPSAPKSGVPAPAKPEQKGPKFNLGKALKLPFTMAKELGLSSAKSNNKDYGFLVGALAGLVGAGVGFSVGVAMGVMGAFGKPGPAASLSSKTSKLFGVSGQ